jgi:hypothetical protein
MEKLKELINNRADRIEESESILRELGIINIKGKREYLQTLLLIIFVASGFVITLNHQINKWGAFWSVTTFLVCALIICIYLTLLLSNEGKSLDKLKKYNNEQLEDLLSALKKGEITNYETFEKFRERKHQEELGFRKENIKDFSDKWFWAINILFCIGTLISLFSYIYNVFCAQVAI